MLLNKDFPVPSPPSSPQLDAVINSDDSADVNRIQLNYSLPSKIN